MHHVLCICAPSTYSSTFFFHVWKLSHGRFLIRTPNLIKFRLLKERLTLFTTHYKNTQWKQSKPNLARLLGHLSTFLIHPWVTVITWSVVLRVPSTVMAASLAIMLLLGVAAELLMPWTGIDMDPLASRTMTTFFFWGTTVWTNHCLERKVTLFLLIPVEAIDWKYSVVVCIT